MKKEPPLPMTDGLPEILLKLLEARGLVGADLEHYLNPSLSDLGDPSDLPGISAAADVILSCWIKHSYASASIY